MPWAIGWKPFAKKVLRGWPSSRRVALPALNPAHQAELKAAVQTVPAAAGIELAQWNWKGVRTFLQQEFGLLLSRSSCLNYLRLGHNSSGRLQERLEADIQAEAILKAIQQRQLVDKDRA
jgi:hypothetical protein